MTRTPHEQEAYELGAKHARNAASWVIDGNTPTDAIRRTVALIDAGDAIDDYLPRQPNLSGEYADDLNPAKLADEILGDQDDTPELITELCDAYEQGVIDTFIPECERILRAAVSS